jgi:hypothetical protein
MKYININEVGQQLALLENGGSNSNFKKSSKERINGLYFTPLSGINKKYELEYYYYLLDGQKLMFIFNLYKDKQLLKTISIKQYDTVHKLYHYNLLRVLNVYNFTIKDKNNKAILSFWYKDKEINANYYDYTYEPTLQFITKGFKNENVIRIDHLDISNI